MTKHAPATPLPWNVEDNGRLIVAPNTTLPRYRDSAADAAYIAHAANAYPQLVEALRAMIEHPNPGAVADPMKRHKMQAEQIAACGNARALLRSLGEE